MWEAFLQLFFFRDLSGCFGVKNKCFIASDNLLYGEHQRKVLCFLSIIISFGAVLVRDIILKDYNSLVQFRTRWGVDDAFCWRGTEEEPRKKKILCILSDLSIVIVHIYQLCVIKQEGKVVYLIKFFHCIGICLSMVSKHLKGG